MKSTLVSMLLLEHRICLCKAFCMFVDAELLLGEIPTLAGERALKSNQNRQHLGRVLEYVLTIFWYC